MNRRSIKPCPSLLLAGLLLVSLQGASAASLHEALEQAWQTQPQATLEHEQAFASRQRQARAWWPAPPSLGVRYKTDRIGRSVGQREWESEVAVPLWMPGQRALRGNTLTAEQQLWQLQQLHARWQLAGEVREALWQQRIAALEVDGAARRRSAAQQLLDDVSIRAKAGELAPLDLNHARLALQEAELDTIQAASRLQQASQQLTALGISSALDTELSERGKAEPESVQQHPLLRTRQAAVDAARARLAEAGQQGRTPPELALAVGSERPDSAAAYDTTLSLSLRLPLPSVTAAEASRHEAAAELQEARLQLQLDSRRVENAIRGARSEQDAAQGSLTLAEHSLQLTRQNQDWVTRAFRLGEQGLPALLRAQNDVFAAEQRQGRAALELQRARSRLLQAQGVLP